MKKLKTGILIKDKVYIRRLQKAIHTEYDQDIECIIFEDIENVCREAKRKQLDLVLIDEAHHSPATTWEQIWYRSMRSIMEMREL